MGADRKNIDLYNVQFRTTQNAIYVRETIKLAKVLELDTDRVARLKALRCKMCFYVKSGICGQAFTERQCGLCDEMLLSGNTNVNVLCYSCGKDNGLCVECGADVELRERRRKHPVRKG